MTRLPPLRPTRVIKVMRVAGFHEDHRSGSHVIMHKDESNTRVSIPYHRKDLPHGTIHAIMRAAGLSRDAFLELLGA